MNNTSFNKNTFDIKILNTIVEDYCKEQLIHEDVVFKVQLITEEFLSNFLFPNFDGEVTFSITKNDGDLILSFEYSGTNFMNRINAQTILSQKILHNKTKEIIVDENNNSTVVKFVV